MPERRPTWSDTPRGSELDGSPYADRRRPRSAPGCHTLPAFTEAVVLTMPRLGDDVDARGRRAVALQQKALVEARASVSPVTLAEAEARGLDTYAIGEPPPWAVPTDDEGS